jgi:Tfp pilus assembly protein PilF
VLRRLGNPTASRATFERALAIDEAVYGPEHPSVGRDVNNLGLVLAELGDLAGARAAFERALAIDEAVYGLDHPMTRLVAHNLAQLPDADDS